MNLIDIKKLALNVKHHNPAPQYVRVYLPSGVCLYNIKTNGANHCDLLITYNN